MFTKYKIKKIKSKLWTINLKEKKKKYHKKYIMENLGCKITGPLWLSSCTELLNDHALKLVCFSKVHILGGNESHPMNQISFSPLIISSVKYLQPFSTSFFKDLQLQSRIFPVNLCSDCFSQLPKPVANSTFPPKSEFTSGSNLRNFICCPSK